MGKLTDEDVFRATSSLAKAKALASYFSKLKTTEGDAQTERLLVHAKDLTQTCDTLSKGDLSDVKQELIVALSEATKANAVPIDVKGG